VKLHRAGSLEFEIHWAPINASMMAWGFFDVMSKLSTYTRVVYMGVVIEKKLSVTAQQYVQASSRRLKK
jgi:hypothetical protein